VRPAPKCCYCSHHSGLAVAYGECLCLRGQARPPDSSCSTLSAWRCRQFALPNRSDPNRRDDRISGFDQVRVPIIEALYRDRSPADVRKDGLKRERLRAVILVVRDEPPIPLDQDVCRGGSNNCAAVEQGTPYDRIVVIVNVTQLDICIDRVAARWHVLGDDVNIPVDEYRDRVVFGGVGRPCAGRCKLIESLPSSLSESAALAVAPKNSVESLPSSSSESGAFPLVALTNAVESLPSTVSALKLVAVPGSVLVVMGGSPGCTRMLMTGPVPVLIRVVVVAVMSLRPSRLVRPSRRQRDSSVPRPGRRHPQPGRPSPQGPRPLMSSSSASTASGASLSQAS
jgi:hypothetical protein